MYAIVGGHYLEWGRIAADIIPLGGVLDLDRDLDGSLGLSLERDFDRDRDLDFS